MIKSLPSLSKRKVADALVLPFFEGSDPAFEKAGLSKLYSSPIQTGDFKGGKEEVLFHYPQSGKDKRLVLVGLGKEKELSKETLRRAYGKAIQALKGKAKSVTIQLPETDALSLEEITEGSADGAILASYVFDAHKATKEKAPTEFIFVGADQTELKRREKIAKGVFFARDLVIQNADLVTPSYLANMAKDLAKKHTSMKATVFGRAQIQKHKLGLLDAVSRSSIEEPMLLTLEYKGAPKSKDLTALVGKGITYDTGGLNLKPTGFMEDMRCDMGGAGAVLGTMHALAALKLPVNVVAVIASTENAIGPSSYKPGDVYISHSGLSVEISNTDAEGRLVLADAISYTQKTYKPARIINIATLTGGAVVALGEEASAIMGNDEKLMAQLIEAGTSTYERVCPLPLFEEYDALLKSDFADLKNSGKRQASPIQGGLFLKRFVEKKNWAHIDIAGTAYPTTRKSYQPVQATGVGVRLFIEFLSSLCS